MIIKMMMIMIKPPWQQGQIYVALRAPGALVSSFCVLIHLMFRAILYNRDYFIPFVQMMAMRHNEVKSLEVTVSLVR